MKLKKQVEELELKFLILIKKNNQLQDKLFKLEKKLKNIEQEEISNLVKEIG